MSKEVNVQTVGFPALLFLVFLVLKLTNVIDWSWWWVTSPLWVGLLVIPILFIGIFFGVLIIKMFFKK